MKIYNYFLYRLYWIFRDFSKEDHKMAIYSTSIASSMFLFFLFYSIEGVVFFFRDDKEFSFGNNYEIWIIFIEVLIFVINYYLFIKSEKFLNQNFKKDKKGGFVILLVILAIIILFVIGANRNREKIVEENERQRVERIR